jgi:hypothetical protein
VDWSRIADVLATAQDERGMTDVALARKASKSVKTLDDLKNQRRTSFTPATLSAFSTALGWPPDTLRRIGEGEDPPPTLEDRVRTLEAEIRAVRHRLDDLADLAERLLGGQ